MDSITIWLDAAGRKAISQELTSELYEPKRQHGLDGGEPFRRHIAGMQGWG